MKRQLIGALLCLLILPSLVLYADNISVEPIILQSNNVQGVLPIVKGGTGGTTGGVTSVFSRAGAVTAQSGDYTAAQVGALATTTRGAASGVASLSAGTLVVENPANATATPTASKIPISNGGNAQLAQGWLASGTATSGYAPVSDGSGGTAWGAVGVPAASYARWTNGATQGATNTTVVIWGTAAETSTPAPATIVHSASNGDYFTVASNGVYSISVTISSSFVGAANIILMVSPTLSNDANSNSQDGIRAFHTIPVVGQVSSVSWRGYVATTDKIFVNFGGGITNVVAGNQISITAG
jgi:hypothetical protein